MRDDAEELLAALRPGEPATYLEWCDDEGGPFGDYDGRPTGGLVSPSEVDE